LAVGQAGDIIHAFSGNAAEQFTTVPNPTLPPYTDNNINGDLPFIQLPPSYVGGAVGAFMDDAAFIQSWNPTQIAAGQMRQIIAYYRSTWGVSDYQSPYAAVVDTPKTINTDSLNPNNFTNGTFTFRVYVDNVGGYATIGKTVTLTNLRIAVTLPQGFVDATNPTGPSSGNLSGYISSVIPGNMSYKDFSVQVLPTVAPGPQSYSVTITSDTGANKQLYGTINVAATPTLNIRQSANLVGVPWSFSSSDWGTVLGLTANTDFQAFTWDPTQGMYVVQPSAKRGSGVFIISAADRGSIALGGSPTQSTQTYPDPTNVLVQTSNVNVALQPGWNLISNPFNYAIALGQLLGIDSGNPVKPLSFTDLVADNLIASTFASYNPDSQGYNYISANTDMLMPNQGYWVYVSSPSAVDLIFPYVFSPFVRTATVPAWKQTEKQWRLQLTARNSSSVDAQNFIGVAPVAVSKVTSSRKPPVPPTANAISLTVNESVSGKVVPMAQVLRTTGGNSQSWDVSVSSKAAGPVSVSWPNLSTVPSDVQFKLTDVSTGATRDLRRGTVYTFNATAGSTRAFKIEAVPGVAQRAVIANVQVNQVRGLSGSVSIAYVLASDATVSVRVLQNGKSIYQAISGRADRAGTNTATWTLRDSANRQVAPGLYQIEVTAEGADGQRVHRTIPVTVTR